MLRYIFLSALFLVWYHTSLAQCSNPGFAVKSSACLNETLEFTNLTTGEYDFEWDFCAGDLQGTPLANSVLSNANFFRARSIQLIEENGYWYGFSISATANVLMRLDFGNEPSSTPVLINLGNVGSVLSSAFAFETYNENGVWHILVANGGANNVILYSFLNGVSELPVTTVLETPLVFDNAGPNSVEVQLDGKDVIALVSVGNNVATSKLVRMNFGNSIVNSTPGLSEFPLTGANQLRGMAFVKECDVWYGFVISVGTNSLYRLNFGNSLMNAPVVSMLNPGVSLNQPVNIEIHNENATYYAFIQNARIEEQNAGIYRINFGASITNTTVSAERLSFPELTGGGYALDVITTDSRWYAYTFNLAGQNLVRISFPNVCSADLPIHETQRTKVVNSYGSSGLYSVVLQATDDKANAHYSRQTITVSGDIAPDINFTSQNICSQHDVNFVSFNQSNDITSYEWNFGDNATSSDPNPIHMYTTASSYYPSLTVTASDGCQNFAQDTLQIFNAPQASFDLPQTLPLCTNQNYVYTNTSIYDESSNPSWQWSVNGTAVANTQDLNFLFATSVAQNVALTAAIPGCSTEFTQNINTIIDGPLVGFDSPNAACQDFPVSFTNTTVGPTSTLSWTFGDGNVSSEENVSNSYDLAGQYAVTLSATNEAGCQNSFTKNITIYSKPQPNFQLELPPFSCSGMPSQFTDLSPSPVDSNITGWTWSFGDDGSGTNTSTLKNPTHVYDNAGQYDVTLTAETNYGCIDSISKTVTIAQTPAVEILNTPACDDVPTTFSTSLSSELQSWNWQIGITQFSIPEPTYLFTNPGSYTVSLDAIGVNNCIASMNKNVIVPQALIPDFAVNKNCVGQSTEFNDVTVLYDDPISTYSWSFGDAESGSGSPVLHSYQNTGNYHVNLNLVTASGCTYSRMKSIAVGNPPQASFTALPDVGVPPLNVNFINTSSGARQYLWNFNDENNTTSAETSPQFTFLDYGNYVVDLTAYNAQNCSHTVSKVVTAALPFIDVGLENLVISENADGLLTGRLVIHNKGNITIQNLNLAIDLSGIRIQQIVAEPIPPYSSILYTLNFNLVKGNQLEYICIEADLTGDNNQEDNSLCTSFEDEPVVIAPYPNPTSGSLHVDWISPGEHMAQIFIHDPLGKLVFENKMESSPGLNSVLLNLERLTQGAYVLSFNAGYTKKVFRFVVNR